MPIDRIVVDEAFINRVMDRLDQLRRQIPTLYDGTAAASYQNLHNLSTWAGTENFAPGKELRDAVLASGQGIETRLAGFASTMEQFYNGLADLLAEADEVESLNTLSVEEFLRYVTFGPDPSATTTNPGDSHAGAG